MRMFYRWHAMKEGKLMDGMYTTGSLCGDMETASNTAWPTRAVEADACAMTQVMGQCDPTGFFCPSTVVILSIVAK